MKSSEELIKLILCLCLVWLICTALASVVQAQTQRKPNVLFIMGDDHAPYVMGAYGNQLARTPNLDWLAAGGVRFNHAYPNSPVCTPSRQSLITGKLPHAAGVTLLRTPLAEHQLTIAEHLKQFGYRTGAVGKMHFNSKLKHGFDYRIDLPEYQRWLKERPTRAVPAQMRVKQPQFRPFVDSARVWLNGDYLPAGRHDEEMAGTFLARRAIEFLEQKSEQPFCLWVSFYEPHSPFDFPIEYAGLFDPKQMPVGNIGREDGKQIPKVFNDLSYEEKQKIVASYYTSVAFLDKNVGLVFDAVKRLNLENETLIIYVGDHGYNLGHHGRFEKHTFWETAVRAPLLISYPQRFVRGKVVNALVEFVDLMPTILDVCGVSHPEELQGQSLVPLLRGKTKRGREYVFSEYLFGWEEAMIRTRRWKLIYTKGNMNRTDGYETAYPKSGKSKRLYDVVKDPDEMTNLAGRPAYQKIVRELQKKLYERLVSTQPKGQRVPPGLSQEEVIDRLLRPAEGVQPSGTQ